MKKNMHESEGKLLRDGIKDRPCTPTESLQQSLKELKAMRQGEIRKKTWKEFQKELLDEES